MPDIDFQKIELNLIPKKGDDPVVFYASQYETARPFKADLFWGESEFAPGVDSYAEIDIRKNDDNLVVITDDVAIDNNEVSVILPVQALTCIGKNLGQVKIYAADDNLIAALNFILEVQADPLAGGVTSETAIDNLESQIEDIATEVIGENYYNKTETNALLADKADKSELPDMTEYYTKTQTDTLLNGKADRTDLATLASKAEVTQAINDEDTALKNWTYTQFATPGYVASNYYDKTEVDNLIDNIFPTLTASGPIASFSTALNKPLVSVTADPLATTITRCGKNFFNASEDNITDGANICTISGSVITNTGANAYDAVRFEQPLKEDNYVMNASNISANGIIRLDYYDGSYNLLGFMSENSPTLTFTMPANATLRVSLYSSEPGGMNVTDLQCELGLTPSAYEAYNGQTVPSTDATTLTTLSGVNNVFADIGDVTVQYKYMSI